MGVHGFPVDPSQPIVANDRMDHVHNSVKQGRKKQVFFVGNLPRCKRYATHETLVDKGIMKRGIPLRAHVSPRELPTKTYQERWRRTRGAFMSHA